MALCGILLRESNDRIAESAEQDQTARLCSLILLNTLRKINSWSRTTGKGLIKYQITSGFFFPKERTFLICKMETGENVCLYFPIFITDKLKTGIFDASLLVFK